MWIAPALVLILLLLASLAAASRGAEATHYYSGLRWESRYVYWRADSYPPPPPAGWLPVLEDAAWEWYSAWTGFQLRHGSPPAGSDAGWGVVAYVPFSTWFPDPDDSDTWAITEIHPGVIPADPNDPLYLASPGWLYFDSEKQYRLDDQGDFDPVGNLRAVALHEWGHWIKLGHTSDPSIMCSPCVLFGGMKSLSQHDIDSVQAVYPWYSGSGGNFGTGGLPKW